MGTTEGDKVLSPYLLRIMDQESVKSTVGEFTRELLEPMEDYFLVEVRATPSREVTVFIDADQGASIDRLAALNRSLYKKVEASGLFGGEGDFSLEVSSPGLEEPLKLLRQYRKNTGRQVEVLQTDGIKQAGVLKAVGESGIVLEVPRGKPKEKLSETVDISFNQIKYTKVRVVF